MREPYAKPAEAAVRIAVCWPGMDIDAMYCSVNSNEMIGYDSVSV